ncbi:MAG: PAS domain-containing protein [Scytolyngbya sp. HA4215-MV1]|nr:PAS domain-containing protein [Scytolyngbya sp. HA4215-MV1]
MALKLGLHSLSRLWQKGPQPSQSLFDSISLLLLGGTFFAIGVTTLAGYWMVRNLTLDKLKDQALTRVQHAGHEIDDWLASRLTELDTIANTSVIRSLDWTTAEPYLQLEQDRLLDFHMFIYAKADGSYYTTKAGLAKTNIRDRRYFQRAMAGQHIVGNPVISRSTGIRQINIAVPIWSTFPLPRTALSPERQAVRLRSLAALGLPANPNLKAYPIGVLSGAMTVQRVSEVVSKIAIEPGSYAFAIDSQGIPIADPNQLLISHSKSLLVSADPTLSTLARSMVALRRGVKRLKLKGQWVYVVYLPLNEADWSLAFVIPQQRLEAPLNSLNLLAASIGMSATFAACLIVLDILRRGQIEQALRQSEEQLRVFVENTPAAVAVLDRDMRYLLTSRRWLTDYRLKSQNLIGRSHYEIFPTLPDRWKEIHQKCLQGAIESCEEDSFQWVDGTDEWLKWEIRPWHDRTGAVGGIIMFTEIITARKQAEKQVQQSLQEKDLLLQEIHHRVKNNLQVVCSLLSLQAGYITDQASLAVFREGQSRVRTMALIHEKLYRSNDLAKTDFAQYVYDLITELFHSYGINPEIVSLKIHIRNVMLGIDTAIPCGLILNELVSNALKYAFPAGRRGNIVIYLRQGRQGEYLLSVSDDGVGIPDDLDFRETRSLGLTLVCTFVAQLRGRIDLDRRNGTTFKISFPISQLETRD